MKRSKKTIDIWTQKDTTISILHGIVYHIKSTTAGQQINRIGMIRNDKFTIEDGNMSDLFIIIDMVKNIITQSIDANPVLHQSYINDAGYMRTWQQTRTPQIEIKFECGPTTKKQISQIFNR
jgi:hypothetical protein